MARPPKRPGPPQRAGAPPDRTPRPPRAARPHGEASRPATRGAEARDEAPRAPRAPRPEADRPRAPRPFAERGAVARAERGHGSRGRDAAPEGARPRASATHGRPARGAAPERPAPAFDEGRPAPALGTTRPMRGEQEARHLRGPRDAGPPRPGGRGAARGAPPPERATPAKRAPKPRFMPEGGGRAPPRSTPEFTPREAAPEPIREKPAAPGTLWLYGQHAVAAALANPMRRNRRLLLTAEAEAALTATLPKPWRLTPERVERARFHTFLPEDSLHQGAALLTEPLNPQPLERLIAASDGPVLLLDQVTDPRNVGAILRSAAAFGAAAVVVQDRNAPPETGALARAASGALEKVAMLREVNLSRVIIALQKAGFWVVGLDAGAKATLAEVRAQLGGRRVALVLGAEESGLRRLQRESCDELARLPMAGDMESLNVSNAAAIALYEFSKGGQDE